MIVTNAFIDDNGRLCVEANLPSLELFSFEERKGLFVGTEADGSICYFRAPKAALNGGGMVVWMEDDSLRFISCPEPALSGDVHQLFPELVMVHVIVGRDVGGFHVQPSGPVRFALTLKRAQSELRQFLPDWVLGPDDGVDKLAWRPYLRPGTDVWRYRVGDWTVVGGSYFDRS